MKKQRFVVTIEMPDGDYISALYLQDLIQSDCDNIGDSYGDDIGRNKVSVTEEKQIDIDKACEEYCNRCPAYADDLNGLQGCGKRGCDVLRDFRKAMEE